VCGRRKQYRNWVLLTIGIVVENVVVRRAGTLENVVGVVNMRVEELGEVDAGEWWAVRTATCL